MPNTPVLPDTRRVDRSKIDEYLLHPINGRGKASFFQAYGFALERWQELRDALLEHASAWPVAELVSPNSLSRLTAAATLFVAACAHPAGVNRGRWCAASGRPTMRPRVCG